MSDAKTLLHARAAELDALLARLDADAAAIRADRADSPSDDEHDPEGSTLSGEWQRVEALRDASRLQRREVDAALERVEDGTYGICLVCGNPIAAGRLDVWPTATVCVACAS